MIAQADRAFHGLPCFDEAEKLTAFKSNRSGLVAWKELKCIDGRTVFVNLDAASYLFFEGAQSNDKRSLITFANGGGNGIGTIAVRATPAEILKGETVSS